MIRSAKEKLENTPPERGQVTDEPQAASGPEIGSFAIKDAAVKPSVGSEFSSEIDSEFILGQATDNELLMQFARHDDHASFEEIFRRHAGLVLQVCRSILGSRCDADDALQATFLVLVRRADSLGNVTSLSAWLYGVAYRVSMRACRLRRKHSSAGLLEEPVSESVQFDDIQQKELMTVVYRELNGIPRQYREVLIECYFQGKTYRQAAESLDRTETSVKGLVARGKKILRNRLVRRGVALTFALAVLAKIRAASAAESILPASASGSLLSQAVWSSGQPATASIQSLSQIGVTTMLTQSLMKPFAAVAVALLATAVPLVLLTTVPVQAQDPGVGGTKIAQTDAAESEESTALFGASDPQEKEIIIERRRDQDRARADEAADRRAVLERYRREQGDQSEIEERRIERRRDENLADSPRNNFETINEIDDLFREIEVPPRDIQGELDEVRFHRSTLNLEAEEIELRMKASELMAEALAVHADELAKKNDMMKKMLKSGASQEIELGHLRSERIKAEAESFNARAETVNLRRRLLMVQREGEMAARRIEELSVELKEQGEEGRLRRYQRLERDIERDYGEDAPNIERREIQRREIRRRTDREDGESRERDLLDRRDRREEIEIERRDNRPDQDRRRALERERESNQRERIEVEEIRRSERNERSEREQRDRRREERDDDKENDERDDDERDDDKDDEERDDDAESTDSVE